MGDGGPSANSRRCVLALIGFIGSGRYQKVVSQCRREFAASQCDGRSTRERTFRSNWRELKVLSLTSASGLSV
jgi:hypothetical protein